MKAVRTMDNMRNPYLDSPLEGKQEFNVGNQESNNKENDLATGILSSISKSIKEVYTAPLWWIVTFAIAIFSFITIFPVGFEEMLNKGISLDNALETLPSDNVVNDSSLSIPLIILLALVVIIVALVLLYFNGAIISTASRSAQGEKVNASSLFSSPGTFRVIVISVLSQIILSTAVMVTFVPLQLILLAGADNTGLLWSAIVGIIILSIIFFAVNPFFVYQAWLQPYCLTLAEGVKYTLQSVSKNWWRAVLCDIIFIVAYIVIILIGILVSYVAGGIGLGVILFFVSSVAVVHVLSRAHLSYFMLRELR